MSRTLAFVWALTLYAAVLPEPIWAQQITWSRIFSDGLHREAQGHFAGLNVSSDCCSFGIVFTGEYADRDLVIHNIGDIPLTVSSASSDNSSFSVPSPAFPQDISSGESLEITVRFSPSSSGIYRGTLTIGPNDGGSVNVALAGFGTAGVGIWQRTFGGGSADGAACVRQTWDGGYVIVGSTSSYGAGGSDAWLIKTDAEGREVWSRTFGGTGDDGAEFVQQTLDGGYILAGWTNSYGTGGADGWLIKADAEGHKQWDRTLGGESADVLYCVQQTSDGYILAGTTWSFGVSPGWGGDGWLIKTDHVGVKEWERLFYMNKEYNVFRDRIYSVQQCWDEGYILAGSRSATDHSMA